MMIRELLIGLGVDTDLPSFNRAEKQVASLAAKADEAAGRAARGRAPEVSGAGIGERLSSEWSTVGAVIEKAANAIANTVREVSDLASRIGRTSAGFRTSSRDLQVLEAGFARAGVSGSELAGTMAQLESKAFGAAFKGDAGAVMGFARLGVSIRGANGQLRNGSELIEATIARLEKMTPSVKRTQLAVDLFGESARQVLTSIDDGSFRRAQKDAKDFGSILGEDVIASTKRLREEQSKLGFVMANLKQSAAGPLIDSLGRIGHQVTEYIRAQNRSGGTALERSFSQAAKLEGPIAKIGELAYKAIPVVGVLVEILLGVGNAIASVAAGVGGLAERIDGLGGVLAAIGGLLFTAFFPVTAVLAGIALAIDDVLTYQRGGDSLIGRMIYGLKEMEKEFTASGKETPWWLKALQTTLDLIANGIPNALKNLDKVFTENRVFKALDKGAGFVEYVIGANKGSARYKAWQEEDETQREVGRRQTLGQRIFGGEEARAIEAQVRRERAEARAGTAVSLAPVTPELLYSGGGPASLPAVPVPSSAQGRGGATKVLQLTPQYHIQASGPDARQVAAEVQSQIESRVPEMLSSAVSALDDAEGL